MSDFKHGFSKILGIFMLGIAGLVLISAIAFYVLANSGLPVRLLGKFDRSFMDGDIEMTGFSIHGFGSLNLEVDSLRIVYPHDAFPETTEMELGGTGPESDTLISLNHLYVRFKPLTMIRLRRFVIPEAKLDGLRTFLHYYDDSTSNLSIFHPSAPKDSSKNRIVLKFSAGQVTVTGNPVLEYSDARRTFLGRISFDSLGLGGMVRIAPEGIGIRKAHVAIDSLNLSAKAESDSFHVSLPSLWVGETRPERYMVSVNADTYAFLEKYGNFRAPLKLESDLGMRLLSPGVEINLHKFSGKVAYIPLDVEGNMEFGKGKPYFNLSLSAPACPLDTLFREYAALSPELQKLFFMDGCLKLNAGMEGSFSKGTFPRMSIQATLPGSGIRYIPNSLDGHIGFDLDACISPSKNIDADLNDFHCDGNGFDLALKGCASGLLSGDPAIQMDARIAARLEQLFSAMKLDFPIKAAGDLDLNLKWNAKLSEIRSMTFTTTAVEGDLVSQKVFIDSDSLKIKAYNSKAKIYSGSSGLRIAAGMDSLFLDSGVNVSARLRNTDNVASITMASWPNGNLTPKLYVRSDNGRAFVKVGPHRFFGRSLNVDASAHKRSINLLLRRNMFLDSLQKIYPDVSREELLDKVRDSLRRRNSVPDFLTDKSFEKADVDIALDTARANLFRKWKLAGNVSLAKGGFASTIMPLKTGFSRLNVNFDGKDLKIDTLGIICGSSDIGIKGRTVGLGRALLSKSRIGVYADIDSRRINLNEIVSAFDVGKDIRSVAKKDVEDISFVTDTLEDVIPELPPMKLIIIPANVNAEVNAKIDSLDFTYFRMNPLLAKILMKDRTVQFIDSGFLSDYGNLTLDAFYSTITRQDISAGANLSLSQLNAEQIISVIPSVDTLMPVLKTFKGRFDCSLSATTKLDTDMNVIPPTLDALLRINGSNLHIDNAGNLRKLTSLLMFKNKDIGDISDFSVSAVVHDSKLEVLPFEFSVDRYRLALWGMQGMDRSMYYHVSILKSPLFFNFGVNVYGTLDKWRWSLTSARYKDGNIPSLTTELDNMQMNISDYVRNIFNRGISKIYAYNKESFKSLKEKEEKLNISSTDDYTNLSPAEYKKIEKSMVDYQIKLEREELDQELEQTLAESYKQTSEMLGIYMSEFEDSAYDNKIRKKVERFKRAKKSGK